MTIEALTDDFLAAIHAYRAIHDVSDAEIARRFGITPQHLNKIMKHTTAFLKADTYEKIYPLVAKYMDNPGTIGTISGNRNVGNAVTGIAGMVKTKIKNDSLSKYKQQKDAATKERKAILDDLMNSDIPDSEKIKIYNIIAKRD